MENTLSHENTATYVERAPRRKTYKAAILSYTQATITQEVVVKNSSDNGAMIETKGDVMIPDHFILSIPLDLIKIECAVRWRKENRLGVVFISEAVHDSQNARLQTVSAEYIRPEKARLRKKNAAY